MCGIFGFVAKNDMPAGTVLNGLKLLEYRGYDSWGIAVKSRGKILVEKHTGKIGRSDTILPPSTMGIGHTRWATHGGVKVKNAHPHLDCTKQIAVLHNGIIENFQELKQDLLKKGHRFVSETDTEVVPHMIEEALKSVSFPEAVRLVFLQLTGMNGIVVMDSASGEIVAAKNGSPLIIGIGKSAVFIASDALGILRHTKQAIFLSDDQMAILGQEVITLDVFTGKNIQPEISRLNFEFRDETLGKYKHFLLKEIYEQPAVIKNVALNYDDYARSLAQKIDRAFGTFMVGCGTASYACLAGTYLFSEIAKKHVNFTIGSEFAYLEDYITPKSLIIALSQSGETIDVIGPMTRVRRREAQVVALVNVIGSTLYRMADYKVPLGAGQEKAVAATKSFTAMVAVLILTAYTLSGRLKDGKRLLSEAAESLHDVLSERNVKQIKRLARLLAKKEHLFLIGRGLSHAAALEATLKIKEVSYLHAEGFPGGELKHGVLALVEKGTPCIVFAPLDETSAEILSNAQEVKARGGYVIGIGPKNNSVFDFFLPTRDVKEATILPQVVSAQLLSYFIALRRGVSDPDKPRNLAKSVTVK